ncbi:histidine kinase dimerization/phospho-acceptor domain-containing protein [Anaerosporobacter sp.]
MDWIDELLGKWNNRIGKSSLKRALMLYIIVAIVGVALLYAVTMMFCDSWRSTINRQYNNEIEITDTNQVSTDLVYAPTDEPEMKSFDVILLKIIDFVGVFSILIYSIIAIYLATHFFYKNKIEEPVSILMEEARYIARDDLSFSCLYESGDELGEICGAFDEMRIQLIKNQEKIWSLMESQRQLNAAFAHDLRTPLTVMQGYTELLVKYYPQGKVSEEKLIDTLQLINGQVVRLQQFAETMKGIHTFESMEIKKKKHDFSLLEENITEIIHGLQ